MSKSYLTRILFFILLPLLGACSKEKIVFDSELPRFELREGYQLLEVIVPQGTLPTDKIYIVGDFNGGEEAAVGNPEWELQKAPDTDVKWGIYLNPADFVAGKTLDDGYYFVSAEQGEERSLDNKDVIHREAPALGQRINVIVYRWADYFNKPVDPGEIIHDGYVIYVVDNSGFDSISMYAWGDAEVFGGWPGIKPTGTVTKDGVTYKYFDTGTANEGLNLNLIFNDNGAGKQLPDYNVTLNQDFYLELTPSQVLEFDPSSIVTHDGYTVYVADKSGWDELYLYMWGTVNDLNGGWPGMSPTGTQKINGVTYTYFDLGAANCDAGLEQHVILNNGNGRQVDDVVVFNLDRDVYIELSSNSAVEIDPVTYNPGEGGDEPNPVPSGTRYIYVQDNTGWDNLYIYAWGDQELFGGWPGVENDSTAELEGVKYKIWTIKEGAGQLENLIFHNNNGIQYDAAAITLDRNYLIIANQESASVEEREPEDPV